MNDFFQELKYEQIKVNFFSRYYMELFKIFSKYLFKISVGLEHKHTQMYF